MTLVRLWPLLAAALPVVWLLWEWPGSRRRVGLALRAASFVAILLAIAEPRWTSYERRLGLAVLSDASASIPAEQLEWQRGYVQELRAAAAGHAVRPVVFDDGVRRGAPLDEPAPSEIRGTNLELALRSALAILPEDRSPRVVLLSDGHESEGSVERAIWQAKQAGAPVDVVPLPGRRLPELRLSAVSAPSEAFAGERFPIELTVESPRDAQVSVRLSAEGKPLGSSAVRLRPGTNDLRVRARIDSEGAALIRGVIADEELGEAQFAAVVSLRRPRALLIAGGEAKSGEHLAHTLREAGFRLDSIRAVGSGPLGRAGRPLAESHDLVVASDQDFERWPEARKRELESFVRGGGGFLMIGGENNLYVERPGRAADPLNQMLPATLAPPRTPEGAAVVLVVDKSSSMEGKKMELARQSAMGVIDNLRPTDQVGVLAFDNTFQWAVPIRRNDDPAMIKRLIGGVIADGGTQIPAALHEAFQHIRVRDAVYKHILLLTDGISEEGDSIQLAREAVSQNVTISTIGLGQDVNRAYLERVAANADGRAYFVLDPAELARVVLRDVLEHTGTSLSEAEFTPRIVREAEILEGVRFDQAGPLLGWVRYEAKPAAETILQTDGEDPLFIRWQYGLGRAAVFASDATNRWAANWVAWPGFGRFWANVARDLLPRAPRIEASAEFDRARGELVISYRGAEPAGGAAPPELFVLGPGGFRTSARLERTAAGAYEARTAIGERYGLFRVRAGSDDELFPELAYLRENEELQHHGANIALLEAIARETGGLFNPSPGEVLAARGRAVQTSLAFWPGLLALAILLTLIEVAARKGLLPWLGRWA